MTGLQLIKFIEESNKIENEHSLQAILNSIDAWIYLKKLDHLTLRDILNVHYLIMKNVYPQIAGQLRTELKINVAVGGRICPNYNIVSNSIIYLITAMNILGLTEKSTKAFHIRFEKIHPFVDGNGRIGRLIWLWLREKAKLPFKLIKFENRQEYYNWFSER